MEGWSEEEIKNKDLMAACGLYCGACGIYIATRNNNEKFRTILANLYGAKSEELYCLGCMQTEPAKMILESCRTCEMKQCLKARKISLWEICRLTQIEQLLWLLLKIRVFTRN